jgi:hypothetical protein
MVCRNILKRVYKIYFRDDCLKIPGYSRIGAAYGQHDAYVLSVSYINRIAVIGRASL